MCSDVAQAVAQAVKPAEPRVISALLGLALLLLSPAARSAQLKIVLVGDSTVNDEGGWGPGFKALYTSDVEIINLAKNGRSSKSFRNEGLWQPALDAHPNYILIQFGHNDSHGKGPDRETDPATTFRANMLRYADEARAAGAVPVFVTSIVRRNFTRDGNLVVDSLAPYVDAVRALAAEKHIALIDLYELTRAQAQDAGPAGSILIGRKGPDGKQDNTHLGPQGQQSIGRMAALELARIEPALQRYLKPVHYVVAADGSGDSKTIQYAIDHAPTVSSGQRLIVEIKPGVYHERVIVPRARAGVTLLGSDAAKTVITANMSAKAAGGTFLSATVNVEADDFTAENITFENTFGVGSQAVAIAVHSDRAAFRNCRFLGMQDTLYAAYGRQYYKDCYIAGHVDFIFGNATAVFEDTEIHSLGAGYITAHSRTTPDQTTGYIFRRCRLTGENTGKGVFLGRPWRPYARVVFLDCAMGGHIRPEGWNNWNNTAENEKTAWYAEAGSTGPGAHPSERAAWAHHLTTDDLHRFETRAFLRGNDGWDPAP